MSISTIKSKVAPWAADVADFAEKEQIGLFLQPLWQSTNELFPTATQIKVGLAADPNDDSTCSIVFEVKLPSSDAGSYIEHLQQWTRAKYEIMPPRFVAFFLLDLDLVSP